MENIKLAHLVELQNKINELNQKKVLVDQYILAFSVELFNYIDSIPHWKWWKTEPIEINNKRIIKNLINCLAFFISMVSELNKVDKMFIENIEYDLQSDMDTFKEEIKNKNMEIVNWCKLIGVNSDIIYSITEEKYENEISTMISSTIRRMSIALYLAELLDEDLKWEDIEKMYIERANAIISNFAV